MNAPRTIGLNLTWLVPGVVGGSEEYTIRLLQGLSRIDAPDVRFRMYARRDLLDRYPELSQNFTPVVMPGRNVSRPRRVALEQTWLARVGAADSVIHHLGGTIPFLRRPGMRGTAPRRSAPRQRVVVTIHDLQPIDMASNFSMVKRMWLGRLLPLAVEHADLIVCPSRFTADRIAARYGAERSRLRVVHQGYRTNGSAAGPPSAGLTERLGHRRFLLFPAIAYRHKRHRDLVEALARLPERLADIDLVFTGRAGPETERLLEQANRLGVAGRLHVLGRVPEADLHWLYGQALALTFPSAYEGFGNPCLEAMARGCPVLAADAAALPEVIDDAGILVPCGDVAGWVRAVTDLADKPELAADLAVRGRKRAAAFDPDHASARLLTVYRDLLGLEPVTTAPRQT